MGTVNQTILNRASSAWEEACRKLGIKIVAPFTLKVGTQSVDCLAFLPDFGSPNGMVIGAILGPKFETDACLTELAKRKGLFYSFINPSPFANTSVEEAVFKEALIDWGFFGPEKKRPSWLARSERV